MLENVEWYNNIDELHFIHYENNTDALNKRRMNLMNNPILIIKIQNQVHNYMGRDTDLFTTPRVNWAVRATAKPQRVGDWQAAQAVHVGKLHRWILAKSRSVVYERSHWAASLRDNRSIHRAAWIPSTTLQTESHSRIWFDDHWIQRNFRIINARRVARVHNGGKQKPWDSEQSIGL